MNYKCSCCGLWVSKALIRNLTKALQDHAVKKKVKLDDSSTYICRNCYRELYKPAPEEPIAGPSGVPAVNSHGK